MSENYLLIFDSFFMKFNNNYNNNINGGERIPNLKKKKKTAMAEAMRRWRMGGGWGRRWKKRGGSWK